MNRKTASPSKLCKLTLVLALFLSLVPALQPVWATNPCAAYPGVCRYTWDPVERCCISDPRFDCYDICFSSAAAPAGFWQADLAAPNLPLASSPVCEAPAGSAAAAVLGVLDFAKR
ncbi:MAG TPA: hypothetical protein VFE33_23725 [Thermoanaerobaculia bacterium]|nr:hypothetical protein [Thermoanaerobaculia bacterium]